jgi:hypothetical protein
MNRKTLLAGAVFAVLLIVCIAVLNSPEKGSRTTEAPRPVPKMAAGDFDTLDVTKDGKTTTIKKDGGTYKVTAPVPYAADQDAAKGAFEAMEKLEFGSSPVSALKSKHDEFEVGAKGVRVVAKKGDKVLADLRVGKAANSSTMVRLEGKDEVWGANGTIKYQFDKDSAAWRDKSITTFDQNDAERLEVVAKSGEKIVLSKPPKADGGADAEWKVVESSVKVEPFDKSVPGNLVSALYSWKANDFADDAKPAETGLDAPDLTVTVGLKGGKAQSVLIGKKKGEEDFYVKKSDGAQVFLVKKYGLERINQRPIEFRDKTMCNLTEGEITQVVVTHDKDSYTLVKDPKKSGNDAWKLAKPAGLTLDPGKVSSILSAFKEWKGTSFAPDSSPKAIGVEKPSATIVASSNVKGHACALKVGAELADKQNLYVSAAGMPDAFVAPKWSVDRVLQKVDDLKKK